jgi:hypothetical protein
MKGRVAALVAATTLALLALARSGHELPVYPSFYPHEIEIRTLPPDRAAALLSDNKLHAYVGQAPRFAAAPSEPIRAVESLGAFVVVRLNPSSARDEAAACAAIGVILRGLAAHSGDLAVHPYPVTPWHGDYLDHVDLAEAAKARWLSDQGRSALAVQKVKMKATAAAERLLPPEWRATGPDWDAEIVEVGAAELVAGVSTATNGWLGPPWRKTGWFHAHLLLADAIGDPAVKTRAEDHLQRLQAGAHGNAVERINVERDLVQSLTAGCAAVVAGFTVKRESFNAEFSAGIENIAYDSIDGLASPLFIRTVKLKDFPWNGWLALGIGDAPAAAWNPIAGFTDSFGRLTWSAVGDPAALPSPYDAAWILNRISDVQAVPRR